MRTAVTALVFLFVGVSAHAQLRLSFVGYSATSTPRSIGSFDETIDDALVIDVSGMREPPNGEWFLSWSSIYHAQNGYPLLADTDAWAACDPNVTPWRYDIIAWLEPGEFVLGQQVPFISGSRPSTYVRGQDWDGRMPWDYTHLRVVLVGQTDTVFEGPYCLKTYLIPIVWNEAPVSTAPSTFGSIKALYRAEGSKP